MRTTIVIRSLISGLAVYVIAAACGGGDNAINTAAGGGEAGAIADAFVDGFVDGVANPVNDANAAEPPDVAVERCDKVLKENGVDTYFAVHNYPGKTAEELALVQVLLPQTAVDGYKYRWGFALTKDGSVAISCGGPVSAGPAPTFTTTFVAPK